MFFGRLLPLPNDFSHILQISIADSWLWPLLQVKCRTKPYATADGAGTAQVPLSFAAEGMINQLAKGLGQTKSVKKTFAQARTCFFQIINNVSQYRHT